MPVVANSVQAGVIAASLALLLSACGAMRSKPADEIANGTERDEAIAAYRRALAENPGATKTWRYLGGELLDDPGAVPEAERAFLRAYELAEARGDAAEMALNKTALGYAALKRKDTAVARLLFHEALEMHRAIGDREAMAWEYAALSSVYLQSGELHYAEKTALSALENGTSDALISGVAQQMLSIGYAYAVRNQQGENARLIARAEDIERRLAEPIRIIDSHNALGSKKMRQGNFLFAEQLFRKALVAGFDNGAAQQIGESYEHLGALYERQGKLAAANSMYADALRHFEASGALQRRRQVAESMGRITAAIRPPDAESANVVDVARLKRVRYEQPDYPEQARLRGVRGFVRLEFTVDEAGETRDITILSAEPSQVFERASIRAVRRWRFEPVVRSGVIVEQRAEITLTFELEDG